MAVAAGRLGLWAGLAAVVMASAAASPAWATRAKGHAHKHNSAKSDDIGGGPANEAPPIGRDPGSADDDAAGGKGDGDAAGDGSAGARDLGHGEVLDNATVLELSRAGLGEAAVAAAVRASSAHYDISTTALIALHKAGVESGVIAAMIKAQSDADVADVRPDAADPAQPHPAGVYVLGQWLPHPRMLAIKPISTARTTSGSILGYAFSGGLVPVRYRAILPTAHAAMIAGETRPVFYFYTGADKGSQKLDTVWGAAPDPQDVHLVRFSQTKNGREVPIGTFTLGGAKTGIADKDSLPFATRSVSTGVLAVRPELDLAPGEYGFVETAAGVGVGGARVATSSARVYDFAVADAAQASRASDEGWAHEYGGGSGDGVDVNALGLPHFASRKTKVVLTKAQEQAAQPSNYPGGK